MCVNVSELILLPELLFREMVLYSWMWKTHDLDHFFRVLSWNSKSMTVLYWLQMALSIIHV